MLASRVMATLRFFDLQDYPLTANEVHRYLINDLGSLQNNISDDFELKTDARSATYLTNPAIHADTILTQLHILTREGRLEHKGGFYCLAGRSNIVEERLRNYLHGLRREKLIARYIPLARHLPFVRSVTLLGSQAMGQQRATSDIDLFVITDERFLGLARFFLTSYFQIVGIRRHGKQIANRFCLNHYLAGSRSLPRDRNLYTAYEYLKYRPLIGANAYNEFLQKNQWVYLFFPNEDPQHTQNNLKISPRKEPFSQMQRVLERLFNNRVGMWIEQKMLKAQLGRIEQSEFTISDNQEMSFHPDNRKQKLFASFFEYQELNHRKME